MRELRAESRGPLDIDVAADQAVGHRQVHGPLGAAPGRAADLR